MGYEISYETTAAQQLKKLPKDIAARIQKSIIKLKDDPRPPGVKKLVGSSHWRIRVGDYRIIYRIEDSILTIVVIEIGHRREIYR